MQNLHIVKALGVVLKDTLRYIIFLVANPPDRLRGYRSGVKVLGGDRGMPNHNHWIYLRVRHIVGSK
jgi:hypothetical protein